MSTEDVAATETDDRIAEKDQDQPGDDFEGSTLLTKPDNKGDKGTEKDAGDDQGKADDSASKVPDNPEGYALKFADTAEVDKELLGSFQKEAHALGISQGNAQRLADMYAAHAAKTQEQMLVEHQKVVEAAKLKWEAEIQGSPGFTQEREHARAALRQYGDSELYNLLDETNLGSHPKMWAFLAKVGKALAEPGFKGESAAGGPKTAADVLYPNQGRE